MFISMYWAYGGWGGQRLLLPYPVIALPISLPYLVGLHSTVIGPFSGCDSGFDYGFDSDCGCGSHSLVIYIFRDPCLDKAVFLFLAVMETDLAGNPRILCSRVAEPLYPSLGGWRHP